MTIDERAKVAAARRTHVKGRDGQVHVALAVKVHVHDHVQVHDQGPERELALGGIGTSHNLVLQVSPRAVLQS